MPPVLCLLGHHALFRSYMFAVAAVKRNIIVDSVKMHKHNNKMKWSFEKSQGKKIGKIE